MNVINFLCIVGYFVGVTVIAFTGLAHVKRYFKFIIGIYKQLGNHFT